MAHVLIDNRYPVLTYESEPYREKYWDNELSPLIMEKYGAETKTDNNDVETILLDCFNFYVNKFKELVNNQDSILFYYLAFQFHETSIDLLLRTDNGYELPESISNDFPNYRRILKLILEQGCDIEVTESNAAVDAESINVLQELYYLGYWIYVLADEIAIQKMIPGAKFIEFEDNILTYGWQNHYGTLYSLLMKELSIDYETFFDQNAVQELKDELETNFDLDYNVALGMIEYIKQQFSGLNHQTIEPYVLPNNLVARGRTTKLNADLFYNGLKLDRNNKLSIEDAVLKPYSEKRYFYRPILSYSVDGVERALIGNNKIPESMMVMATNAILWNTMAEEWRQNKGMLSFLNKKGNEHDSLLEDEIEKIFIENKFPYCRNIKSFKQINKPNVKIDIPNVGEIDFIVVNKNKNKIYIADTKYNKARYEAVGFRLDYSNFKNYEIKLKRKFDWLTNNLQVLQEHLEILFHVDYSILDFEIEAIFFINTPTFYMLKGDYKAITSQRIKAYIEGTWNYPPVILTNNAKTKSYTYNHPYFNNNPIITDIT